MAFGRRVRLWAAIAVLLAPSLPLQAADPVPVEVIPVPLDPTDPAHDRIGSLTYRAGFELKAPDHRFGGLSALLIEGDRLIAVTDNGSLMQATLLLDHDGTLTGLEDVRLSPLADTDGDALGSKRDADAESLARDPDGGIIVTFEHRHRLWRYPQPEGAAIDIVPPRELPLAPGNDGIEALTRLADGRLLAITEGFRTQGGVLGWVGTDNAWTRFTYEGDGLFSPTGATTLANGDVLVLERHYSLLSGIAIRVARLGSSAFAAPGPAVDSRVRAEILAELRLPLTVDNMEGIAAVQGPRGETLVYLLSDDNFQRLTQRTLLMQFELAPDVPDGERAR